MIQMQVVFFFHLGDSVSYEYSVEGHMLTNLTEKSDLQ